MKTIMTDVSTGTHVNSKPILSEFGQLSRPDGAASFSQGETLVHCAVYGPVEARVQSMSDSEALVEVVFKPKIGLSGCSEKFDEHSVKTICQSAILLSQYPRTSISIILQEMQNSGCLLACSINAACLALMDAGVAMHNLFAASSCVISSTGEILLDPTLFQEKDCQATMTFAFDSKEYSKIFCLAEGIFSQNEYGQCLTICRNAAKNTFQFYRDAVTRSFSKTT